MAGDIDSINNQRIIDARAEIADAKADDEAAEMAASDALLAAEGFPFVTTSGEDKVAVDKYVDTDQQVVLIDEDDVEYKAGSNGLWDETDGSGSDDAQHAALTMSYGAGAGTLTLTVDAAGFDGNGYTFRVLDDQGANAALTVAVATKAITLHLGKTAGNALDATKNTIALAVALINNGASATHGLVTATDGGTTSTLVTAGSLTPFTGGTH